VQSRLLTTRGRVLGQQFLTFALIGAVGTAVHYAMLVALIEAWGVNATLATTVGFACGAAVNYTLNRRFTFASERSHQAALPQFLAVAALGAALNYAVFEALTDWPSVHYLVAQAIATGLVLVWNFVANRYWTFAK
jgi:putative flippase GtrA